MPFPSQSLFSAPLPSPGNHYLDFLHHGLILPVLELHAKGTWSMYLVCLVSLVQHNVFGIYLCLLFSIPAGYSFLFHWMHIPLFSYPYFSLMDICVVYRLLQIKSLYLWTFLLKSFCGVVVFSCSVVSNSLWPHQLYIARQAPLPIGFSRQEHWSGLPFPSPGDLPNPGIKPVFDSLPLSHQGSPISH